MPRKGTPNLETWLGIIPAWPQPGDIPGQGLSAQPFSDVLGTPAAIYEMCPAPVIHSQQCGSATATGAERYGEGFQACSRSSVSPWTVFSLGGVVSHKGKGPTVPSADEVGDVRTICSWHRVKAICRAVTAVGLLDWSCSASYPLLWGHFLA